MNLTKRTKQILQNGWCKRICIEIIKFCWSYHGKLCHQNALPVNVLNRSMWIVVFETVVRVMLPLYVWVACSAHDAIFIIARHRISTYSMVEFYATYCKMSLSVFLWNQIDSNRNVWRVNDKSHDTELLYPWHDNRCIRSESFRPKIQTCLPK